MEVEVLATGSKGNCYVIRNKDTALLIECGIRFTEIQKKLNFNLSIDGCLLTHSHKDHSLAAENICKRGINLYTSKGTAEELGFKHHRLKILKKKQGEYVPIEIGSFKVIPFRTQHDTKEPVGFYIVDTVNKETLLFVTDTVYLEYTFPKVTYLMIECNYIKENLDRNVIDGYLNVNLRNRIVKNHMSLETLLEFISVNNWDRLSEIYILHLSDNNSDEEVIKNKVQEATGRPVVIC